MLIYEKDNKLNINFENSVNESPDLQISKSGDKTEVLIDGQSGGGSGGDSIECAIRKTEDGYSCDMTEEEISSAIQNGTKIQFVYYPLQADGLSVRLYSVQLFVESKGIKLGFVNTNVSNGVLFTTIKIKGSTVTATEKTIS